MKRHIKYLSLALLALMFTACDNNNVPREEYEALAAEREALVAENDSLQFELSCLQTYVECLEEDKAELEDELRRTKCY